jgi:hypothetical protein
MNLTGADGTQQALNFNPESQKVLLSLAANRKPVATGTNNGPTSDEETVEGTKDIPVANFKSNKLSQIDKKQRAEELDALIKSGKD